MLNLNRLLKKKKWTGQDMGRLEMVNMLTVFQQTREGKPPKQIISNEDFQTMLRTVVDPEQKKIYKGYLKIHDWFSDTYGTASAYQQQAFRTLDTVSHAITSAHASEDIYSYISGLPMIVTAEEYEELKDKRIEETLHPAGEEEPYFNVFNMLGEALRYYTRLLEKSPRKRNPLKPLKDQLEAEPVTDKRILELYNIVTGKGFFELPDGSRSDNMTEAEWEAKLEEPEIASALEKHFGKTLFNGFGLTGTHQQPIDYETLLSTFPSLAEIAAKNIGPDALEALREDGELTEGPATWHYYEEPQASLNKWEIIVGGELEAYYPALQDHGDEAEDLAQIRAFKEEFPAVTAALLQDMERYVKGISSVPEEEWTATHYTWEELYQIDYYSFASEYVENDLNIFDGDRKAINNGVAILRPSDSLDTCDRIDKETGYYQPPKIRETLASFSLEAYFPDNPEAKRNLATLRKAREVFKDSYYYLVGYNLSLDLIAELFKLDEMKVAKISLDPLNARIKSLNRLINDLYRRITMAHYEDTELKEKKLAVIREELYPVDTSQLTPSEEAIEKAKDAMRDYTAFVNNKLSYILFYRPQGGTENG